MPCASQKKVHSILPAERCDLTKFGWTVLPYPPYSPDLALSDFQLFGPLKEGLRKQNFVDNNAVVDAVKKWTATARREFYQRGIQARVHRWKKCIENAGDYVEK